jgi:hypothetical protein
MRAGSPERGQPTLPCRKTPRRRWDGTSHHPMRAGGGLCEPKQRSRPVGESALEGGNPRRQRRAGSFGIRSQHALASGSRPWSRPRPHAPLGARRTDASNATRAGAAERRSDRCEEKALRGEADGRSGAARRREERWWTPRGRYPNLGRGTQRGREVSRYAGPPFRMCRTAREPRGGSIVRRVGLRAGGTVRGSCDGPL